MQWISYLSIWVLIQYFWHWSWAPGLLYPCSVFTCKIKLKTQVNGPYQTYQVLQIGMCWNVFINWLCDLSVILLIWKFFMLVKKLKLWVTKWFTSNIPCVASVSVPFRSKERGTRIKDRAKRARGGEERKETLAGKPLDFENRPLGLSCLSSLNNIWCCHQLS